MSKAYCVYKHTSPSGKSYIGITGLKPNYRWNYGLGYRPQTIFGGAIKKYGWENIKHEILFSGLTESEAKFIERSLISIMQTTDRRYGYNETLGGEGMNGYKHTDETIQHLREVNLGANNPMFGRRASTATKEKMSKARMGHAGASGWKQTEQAKKKIGDSQRGELHPRARKVCQFSLSGEFIAEHPTLTEAAARVGGQNQHIAHCCRGSRKQHCGYIWRYA